MTVNPTKEQIENTARIVKEKPEADGIDNGEVRVIDPDLQPGSFAADVAGHVQGLGNLSIADAQAQLASRDMSHEGVTALRADQEAEAAGLGEHDPDLDALQDAEQADEPADLLTSLATPNGAPLDPLNPEGEEPEGVHDTSGGPSPDNEDTPQPLESPLAPQVDPLDKNGNGVMDVLEDEDDE